MKNQNVIFVSPTQEYRIVELPDLDWSFEDLCGDFYNPEVNPDIDESELIDQLEAFTKRVETEGVFGYVLEKWNPKPNCGWERVDSCWGFIGSYNHGSEENNHYVIDEMKSQIPTETSPKYKRINLENGE
jgi:hypothetical protein